MSAAARLRLMAMLSPAFPVGSFSYSTGLEGAVHLGLISGSLDLETWIIALLRHGSLGNDAVLFCEAARRAADGRDVADVAELGETLAGSQERHRETMLQGAAFLAAVRGWPGLAVPELAGDTPYCVAVGAVSGANAIDMREACAAYLQSSVSNLLQAAIRLSLIGQREAVALLGRLEPVILDRAAAAAASTLDDLGSAAIMADIAAMRHETQYSRLFRS